MIKILSPVTSFEGAVAAISAGANELYCGVKIEGVTYLGLSTRPTQCSLSSYNELERITKYAHDHNVEVFVTSELPFMAEGIEKEIKNTICSCVEKGVDAIIASDIGIALLIKDMGLKVPIHASTYMASMNYEAVSFLRRLDVKRVVLERHLAIDEIREIVKHHEGFEIEIFVHGPGCSNINVNCYGCTDYVDYKVRGPPSFAFTLCRLPYDIYKMYDNGQMKVGSEQILDAFFFCSLCRLPELVQTGVTGLKIVGRGAPTAYVEATTRMYRELLDLVEQNQIEAFNKKLEEIKSREHNPGLPPNTCKQKRCYYQPFFHAPYKISPSPKNSGADHK